jgi:hypothetical protein
MSICIDAFLNASDSRAIATFQHLESSSTQRTQRRLTLLESPEGDSRYSRQSGSRRTFLPQRGWRPRAAVDLTSACEAGPGML